MKGCWFDKRGLDAGDCEGPTLVRVHLLPQQLMRQEFPHGVVLGWTYDARAHPVTVWRRAPRDRRRGCSYRTLKALQSDPRGWVRGCGGTSGLGGHHAALDTNAHDSGRLRLPRALLPADLWDFAGELALTWWLEMTYQ